MDAKTALENNESVFLFYDAEARTITTDGGGACSVEEAAELFDRVLVCDCNVAMERLRMNDFDMDAVAEQYRQMAGDT